MLKPLFKASVALALTFAVMSAQTAVAYAPTEPAEVVAPVTSSTPPTTEDDLLMCNCYAYVRSLIPSFPAVRNIVFNSKGLVGVVAIFDYPHYALITEIEADGFWVKESNYKHCTYGTRFVKWSDPHLLGFWNKVDTSKS